MNGSHAINYLSEHTQFSLVIIELVGWPTWLEVCTYDIKTDKISRDFFESISYWRFIDVSCSVLFCFEYYDVTAKWNPSLRYFASFVFIILLCVCFFLSWFLSSTYNKWNKAGKHFLDRSSAFTLTHSHPFVTQSVVVSSMRARAQLIWQFNESAKMLRHMNFYTRRRRRKHRINIDAGVWLVCLNVVNHISVISILLLLINEHKYRVRDRWYMNR